MSDREHSALTARLVVQRLAMPGVLDSTPVQRRYERSQEGMVKHELTGQLHQRATASGETGGGSFVWRRSSERAGASAEGLPVSPGTASVASDSSTPISRVSSPVVPAVNAAANAGKVVQRAALPGAESAAVTDRLTSRAQSPGVLAVGNTMSRPAATNSFSDAPAFAAHLQARYGVTSSESAASTPVHAAPAPSISRAPAGVVRRKVDAVTSTAPSSSHDTTSIVRAVSPISRGTAAAPTLARKVDAVSAMGRALPAAGPPAGNGWSAAPDSRPAGSSPAAGTPVMPAARPLLSAGSAAGAPLVLRRLLAGPGQSSTPLSPVMPPATVQLPREETPAPLPQKPNPYLATAAGEHAGSDIDRIAEEVGRRLMRRLEIERERKGIRQWR